MTVNAKNRVPGQKSREMEEHSMKKRVCLLVALLALVIMGFTMNVEAAEIIDRGYCGGEGDGTNLTWTLDSDGVLVIEGQGRMKDWTWEDVYDNSSDFQRMDWHKYYNPEVWANNVINSAIVADGVTSIGNYAFSDCESLSSIVMPESVTSIGDFAFYYCTSLSIIDLPESVTSIGDRAFSYCHSLGSIDLPESVTSIGNGVFYYCESLSSIIIPESVTSIGDSAFAGCSNLINIKLPKSLTSIGYSAFEGCYNLSSIKLPKSLTSIGDSAFEGCCNLSSIKLPDSLTSIGDSAFKYCTNLDSIYIPVSIETIYRNTFAFTNLEVISYGGTKEQWKNINILQGYDEDTDYTLPNVHCADDDIDYEKLKEFVSRLYQNFLKREPDEKGLNDWIDVLRSGKATGAKVVAGFVLSPEYKANSLSDEEYVTALYRIIFKREPDDAGLNSWLAVMKKGYTYKKVLSGFINSNEFENLCRDLGIVRGSYKSDEPVDQGNKIEAFVARLYKVCLGRAYDQDGLDNWVRALTSGTASVYSIVKEFFDSQEFENRNLDDTEFVTVAYQTILGREPDKSGLEYWVNNLTWGDTRDDVLYGFLGSNEFKKLCEEYGIIW